MNEARSGTEQATPRKSGWEAVANPLTLAIVGGIITLMTSIVTGHISAKDGMTTEAAKARLQLEGDLIEKFVDNADPQKVRANLSFLADVGLVPDYADGIHGYLKNHPDNASLPSLSSDASSMLQTVHSANDAIALVMQDAGGFYAGGNNPRTASNFGIGLELLGEYLGRTATLQDLQNLTPQTAQEIYASRYMTGNVTAIASPRVAAAYLNLAATSGPVTASRLFEAAVAQIDGQPAVSDAALSPATVQRINAVDPDLLIETANCGAVKRYKSNPMLASFAPALIETLRRFSPASLHGVCPELATGANAAPPAANAPP